MIQILEYISQNYTLFFIVLVLILLAIIGYYADKNNFGQGKNKDKELNNHIEENKVMNDTIQTEKSQTSVANVENSKQEQMIVENIENLKQDQTILKNIEDTKQERTPGQNIENLNQESNNEQVAKNEILENNQITSVLMNEESLNNSLNSINLENNQTFEEQKIFKDEQEDLFNKEIESLLPKKELINGDLLNEIEGMEFNLKTEKTSFDVPSFNNISLPKIKNLVDKEHDIWKL